MLQRMLGSVRPSSLTRNRIFEPLNYLGYFNTVDKAPYDHINAGQAVRELVDELPEGEADYLEALRAYTNSIYGKLADSTGHTYFLDKTPAYGLVLPFLEKLYPEAHYVVLTRHPMAIHHSVAHSLTRQLYQAMQDNPGPGLRSRNRRFLRSSSVTNFAFATRTSPASPNRKKRMRPYRFGL